MAKVDAGNGGERPVEVGEGHQGMERAGARARRPGGRQDVGAVEAAGVDDRLARIEVEGGGDLGERVVGHGEEGEVAFVEDRGRLRECPRTGNQRTEPRPALGVAAGDRGDLPARPAQGDAEGRPDGAGADDPDDRAAVVGRSHVRVEVRLEVDLVPVAMGSGRQGRRLAGDPAPDLGHGRRIARGRRRRVPAPRSHRRSPRYSWGDSVAPPAARSPPRASEDHPCRPVTRSAPEPAWPRASPTTTAWRRSPTARTSAGHRSR